VAVICPSMPWPHLKAALDEWLECLQIDGPICPEPYETVLEEIDQLQGEGVLVQPMAEALKTVCKEAQRDLAELQEGVLWAVPPPMYMLMHYLLEYRAAAERSDLTQTEASALKDQTAQSLMYALTREGVLTEDATLQTELVHLLLKLADC